MTWNYSDKVQEHFFSRRNVGLETVNARSVVSTIACGAAFASSSALTQPIIGKTVDVGMIRRAVRINGLATIEQVTHHTNAARGSLSCCEAIEHVLVGVHEAIAADGHSAADEAYMASARGVPVLKDKTWS